MSGNRPGTQLSEEQLQKVAGGDCTVQDLQVFIDNLQQNYEALIEFTSYVIERVAK